MLLMEKVASNYNFALIESLLEKIRFEQSDNTLNKLKNELNKFFTKIKCKGVIYTNNTDKLFFGMRVYPVIDSNTVMDFLGDSKPKTFECYFVELDSKLFDPVLNLTDRELTAILLHEVGHIVNDTETIDEVRKQIDMYMVKSGDTITFDTSKGYRELLAYALKDSVFKVGSIFSKIGNDEIVADSFVFACGYGPDLESGMVKITRSANYLNKAIDDRLITLAWVLRLKSEFNVRRIPAIKTLNKAKLLTASELETRDITYASNVLSRMNDPISEGAIDDMKARFSKKFNDFKVKGVRSIKADAYELNVRLRCAESEEDLLYIVRTLNTDIAILNDYITEDLTEEEREEAIKALQYMYDLRDQAAKKKEVRNRYSSLINVVYPEL
jgi:hypothetical protein